MPMMSKSTFFHTNARIAPTLVAAVALLSCWEALVRVLKVAPYILPTPTSIVGAMTEHAGVLIRNAGVTLFEALAGLLLALTCGVVAAVAFQLDPRIDEAGQPLVAGFQSFPKEAIAPLLVVWFGFGLTSKLVLACSIAFFPVFLSTLKGLKSVPDDIIHTFLALRASRKNILLKARIPYSFPFLFAGLRVASTLSIVGAVIGEFLGSSRGLGHLILVANSQFAVALVFACLALLAVMGILLDVLIRELERKLVPWHESVRGAVDLAAHLK